MNTEYQGKTYNLDNPVDASNFAGMFDDFDHAAQQGKLKEFSYALNASDFFAEKIAA